MKRSRAKEGGEYGVNGEWYKGGWFLPASENTVQGEMRVEKKKIENRKQRKEMVEPYKYECPPQGKTAILHQLDRVDMYGLAIDREMNSEDELHFAKVIEWAYIKYEVSADAVNHMVNLYKAGERWMDGDRHMNWSDWPKAC